MNDQDVRDAINNVMSFPGYSDGEKQAAIMFLFETQVHARLRDFVITTSVRHLPEAVAQINEYSTWFMQQPLPKILAVLWKAKTFGEALKREEEIVQFAQRFQGLWDGPIMHDERQS